MLIQNASDAHSFVTVWGTQPPASAARQMTYAIEGLKKARAIIGEARTDEFIDLSQAIGVLLVARLRFRAAAGEIRLVASEPIR